MLEKYSTAAEQSYRDPSNLLPKLQKHQAFEAELKGAQQRVDYLNWVCTSLFSSLVRIEYRINELSCTM
jgi:hypothetical protein